MKYLLTAALAAAVPASALAAATQETAEAPAPSAEVDPERLALASEISRQILPDGSLKKLMEAAMAGTTEGMMDGFLEMQAGDLIPAQERQTDEERAAASKTLRELLAKHDPHFLERMRISQRVIAEEIITGMAVYEPSLRDALAKAYARRFSLAQLTDIATFYASPSGRVFAVESLTLGGDPELLQAASGFMPDFMKRMPAIHEKMKAATAHLPPPPERKRR